MENTRRYRRYKVNSKDIQGTIVFANYVKINDISLGGISLTTEKRLILGNEYTLNIKGKETRLTVKGAVLWSFLSEGITDSSGNVIPIYKTGIKFVNLSTEQENNIIRFIEDHKKEPDRKIDVYTLSGNRLNVRFQVTQTDKAILEAQDNYRVKNISLSGLLIESEHDLKLEDKINMHMTFLDNNSISFLGRVVTCMMIKSLESQSYEIGIEFIGFSEKDEEMLKKFISSLSETP